MISQNFFLKTRHTAYDISACIVTALTTSLSYFQFAEKFQEVKEAAKLARDKSQEKVETLSNHSQVKLYLSADWNSDSVQHLCCLTVSSAVTVGLHREKTSSTAERI